MVGSAGVLAIGFTEIAAVSKSWFNASRVAMNAALAARSGFEMVAPNTSLCESLLGHQKAGGSGSVDLNVAVQFE